MPAIKSSPSFGAFSFDVPEPQFFDGEFVYNYFIKDERVTDNVFSNADAVKRNTPRSDYSPYNSVPGVPSRKIVLKFTALENITNLPNVSQWTEAQRKVILQQKYSQVVSEVGVQTERTTFVATQDDKIAASLQATIDSTLLSAKASERGLSPLEAALKFNSLTSDKVSATDILEATEIEANSGLTHYDPATGEDIVVQRQGGVSRYAVGGFYNSKFVHDILVHSENAPFSPLWGTVSSILEETDRIQLEAVSSLDSNKAYTADYEYMVDAIEWHEMTAGAYTNSVAVCGYLIEKSIVNDDGSTTLLEIIPVASLTLTQTEDYKVIYGKTYKYNIKSVFFLTTVAAGPVGAGKVNLVTYLISSRGSEYIEVACKETVPPAPPENIQFFLSSEQNMIIFWDMPINTQEDIKRFQIFRRLSLEEPYMLVAELDFDDSEVLTSRSETVPSFSNHPKDHAVLNYEDPDFEFDTEYYYALCSVDAHDLSSSYSTQFKVKYDRINAKMATTLIGWAGAPKPYPNFTIKETLIVDCIKDSGHSKMKVYFDPECLVLESELKSIDTGTGLSTTPYRTVENYFETNSGTLTGVPVPMYKMQIINLDRQQDQKLDIYLKRSATFDSDLGAKLAGD